MGRGRGVLRGGGGVLGGSGFVFLFRGVLGHTLVRNISFESTFVVSSVGNGLGTAVGKGDLVGAWK